VRDPSAIEVATRRLQQALDALEVAVERRLDAAREEDKLANQVGLLSADRSRLAAELDAVASRARRLEATNKEVAGRLETAMETIRSVVGADAE
jgi:uncharacterized protein DUF4164